MEHYFVDTNVVLDMLVDREGYAESATKLFVAARKKHIRLFICALSYSTIYYVLRKYGGRNQAMKTLKELMNYVTLLPVDTAIIEKAMTSAFSDFEDAIQYYSALQENSITAIITRNIKDYTLSELTVLLPTDVI